MNEDIFPIENCDFPASHVLLRGVYLDNLQLPPHFRGTKRPKVIQSDLFYP